jgi:hypothetical protein
MNRKIFANIAIYFLITATAWPADRRLTIAEYQDKVYGAWIGQIIGASYGFNFER